MYLAHLPYNTIGLALYDKGILNSVCAVMVREHAAQSRETRAMVGRGSCKARAGVVINATVGRGSRSPRVGGQFGLPQPAIAGIARTRHDHRGYDVRIRYDVRAMVDRPSHDQGDDRPSIGRPSRVW